ncbi:MAG: LysM peptidoglycan-binding domain-containing protein [Verrucomicrobiota bacterium]
MFIIAFTICTARGQDAATQEQIGKLSGQIQDMLEAQAAQSKHISVLEKEISDLRDKLNQPAAANDSASSEDLKKLAEKVQEIDRKRQADNEQILKTIEKLAKAGSTSARKSPVISNDTPTPAPGTKQKGYDYTIVANDTVSGIAKKYGAEGVKVTTSQILAANPGLNPNALIVGKKIFIPDPNAK